MNILEKIFGKKKTAQQEWDDIQTDIRLRNKDHQNKRRAATLKQREQQYKEHYAKNNGNTEYYS